MKITILSRNGIDQVVNEALEALPLPKIFERIELVSKPSASVPLRGEILESQGAYSKSYKDRIKQVEVLGLYGKMPRGFVASSFPERKELLSHSCKTQNQLILLGNGVYFRHLYNFREYMAVTSVQSIYFHRIGRAMDLVEDTTRAVVKYFLEYENSNDYRHFNSDAENHKIVCRNDWTKSLALQALEESEFKLV